MERDVITMQEIFAFEKTGVRDDGRVCGRFRATGIRPKCSERLTSSGMRLPVEMFEHVRVVA
jgi:pilus assembly protein CpaF